MEEYSSDQGIKSDSSKISPEYSEDRSSVKEPSRLKIILKLPKPTEEVNRYVPEAGDQGEYSSDLSSDYYVRRSPLYREVNESPQMSYIKLDPNYSAESNHEPKSSKKKKKHKKKSKKSHRKRSISHVDENEEIEYQQERVDVASHPIFNREISSSPLSSESIPHKPPKINEYNSQYSSDIEQINSFNQTYEPYSSPLSETHHSPQQIRPKIILRLPNKKSSPPAASSSDPKGSIGNYQSLLEESESELDVGSDSGLFNYQQPNLTYPNKIKLIVNQEGQQSDSDQSSFSGSGQAMNQDSFSGLSEKDENIADDSFERITKVILKIPNAEDEINSDFTRRQKRSPTQKLKENKVTRRSGTSGTRGRRKPSSKRWHTQRPTIPKENGDSNNDPTLNPFKNRVVRIPRELNIVITKLLDQASKRDSYGIFFEPVNPEEVPDYYKVITNPMDFGTMRTKIEQFKYEDLDGFLSDLRLVCENAMTYNDPSTVFYKSAQRILELGLAAAEKERPYILPNSEAFKKAQMSSKQNKEDIVDIIDSTLGFNDSPMVASPFPNLKADRPVRRYRKRQKIQFHTGLADGSLDPQLHTFNPAISIPKLEQIYNSKKPPVDDGQETYAGFLDYGSFPTSNTPLEFSEQGSHHLAWGDHLGLAYASSLSSFVSGLGPQAEALVDSSLNHISCNAYSLIQNIHQILDDK